MVTLFVVKEALQEDLIGKISYDNQWSKLKEFIVNGTFLEIGSGMTAFSVAAYNSSNTVVAVITAGGYTASLLDIVVIEMWWARVRSSCLIVWNRNIGF